MKITTTSEIENFDSLPDGQLFLITGSGDLHFKFKDIIYRIKDDTVVIDVGFVQKFIADLQSSYGNWTINAATIVEVAI